MTAATAGAGAAKMISLKTLLENDREAFIAGISAPDCKTREAVAEKTRLELDRLLFMYNDAQTEPAVQEALEYMVRTARESCRWLCTDPCASPGQGHTLKRPGQGKMTGWQIPRGTGHVLAVSGAVILAVWTGMLYAQMRMGRGADISAPSLLLWVLVITAGAAALYAGGRLAGEGREKSAPEEGQTEVMPDPQSVYNGLLAVVLAMEEAAQNVRERAAFREHLSFREGENEEGMNDAQLVLLSKILEETWCEDDEVCAGIRSQISFYLHERGIAAVEFTPERADWFDRMPGEETATIRPALAGEDGLLWRGLAVTR